MSHYNEAAFESAIEIYLTEHEGYKTRPHTSFDRELCLDTEVFIDFVKSTQPKEWDYLYKIHKDATGKQLIEDLVRALNSEHEGTLNVLRHGFKCFGRMIHAAYFAPASGMNPETQRLYQANILSITRQARYSTKHENSVDVVLTVNGIPVVTLELKNQLTHQTWMNAIQQYKNDRDPNDLLFSFRKRALVHFAVDCDEAYMTTRLSGTHTYFLPFNKGCNNGKGNPDNPTGYKTAYLWEEVLARDSLMDILARFMHLQVEEKKAGDRVIRKESIIFPRYHQLRCVRRLIETTKADGAGRNYLIQHSAGSGKSNSIAWVAHRLASLHDDEDNRVFSSVVVITDRLVLDQQLQNTIFQFEHKAGVVEKINTDSTQLANALNAGTPIIITTLQKFPFVIEKVSTEIKNRKYAVIVDEAHSSMGGETAAEMKGVLGDPDADEEFAYADTEEEVLKAMAKRGKQKNLSFYAFTATPKYKTLEVFGREGVDGKPEAFDLYSMRQAIEEGFILDVLDNYTTYKTYYQLIKEVADNPKVDKRKTSAALARFLSLHPHNIAQKTEVIIEHFRQFTRHKIGGQAKAMVVARSRLHAVRYKIAFDAYIKTKGYTDLKTLVAFSGTVSDGAVEYTEVGMNLGIKEKELPEKFNTAEYCVLIVADKYQTGFDQPLLHTMYVDKRLGGIQAIQTLSRLNRTCAGKEDTFVLDFVNEPQDIQDAFQPYYEKTIVGERVDYKKLYELSAKMDGFQIFFPEEVAEFCRLFFAGRDKQTSTDHATVNRIIDPAVSRFKARAEDEQEEFRSSLQSYKTLYAFLAQIIPFYDSDLEKLYTFLRFLQSKLPRREQGSLFDVEGEVALKYYRLQLISEGSISLEKNKSQSIDGMTELGTGKGESPEEELSKIIEILNEKFKTDFTPADELFLDSVAEEAVHDSKVRDAAAVNTIDGFGFVFDERIKDIFLERLEQNELFTDRFMNDEDFKKVVSVLLMKQVYERIRAELGIAV
ncbi:MAG: restriction endonuclease subunit R [Spirochaetae bacterium HGW-Spirochaetae-3]|nr:MAG: restriction endonuclease subunit R [Spirochaetae bacterium HGW-Spirochaetae-3]